VNFRKTVLLRTNWFNKLQLLTCCFKGSAQEMPKALWGDNGKYALWLTFGQLIGDPLEMFKKNWGPS
jgi:hypothetical protein